MTQHAWQVWDEALLGCLPGRMVRDAAEWQVQGEGIGRKLKTKICSFSRGTGCLHSLLLTSHIFAQDSELTVVPDVYTRNHGFQQEAPPVSESVARRCATSQHMPARAVRTGHIMTYA